MPLRSTKGFANPAERLEHFANHAADFGASSDSHYEELADVFLSKPRTADMFECRRALGDRVRYDRATNEFGILSSKGIIRTYFIPKKCSTIPKGVRRINCHRFPTHLDYAKDACSVH
jgi:pyocin large subunit-like protein